MSLWSRLERRLGDDVSGAAEQNFEQVDFTRRRVDRDAAHLGRP